MERVEEKFDAIIEKLDEHSKIFATKEELNDVKKQIGSRVETKKVWIQTWGALFVAIVSAVAMILSSIVK